jgi:hypothetical protein
MFILILLYGKAARDDHFDMSCYHRDLKGWYLPSDMWSIWFMMLLMLYVSQINMDIFIIQLLDVSVNWKAMMATWYVTHFNSTIILFERLCWMVILIYSSQISLRSSGSQLVFICDQTMSGVEFFQSSALNLHLYY